jgi:hypothetical protein
MVLKVSSPDELGSQQSYGLIFGMSIHEVGLGQKKPTDENTGSSLAFSNL